MEIDNRVIELIRDFTDKANRAAQKYKEIKEKIDYLNTYAPLGAGYEIKQLTPKKAGQWGRYKAHEYCRAMICIKYGIDEDALEAMQDDSLILNRID